MDTDDYWLGLYKLNGRGWYATYWMNGSPATYRDWAEGYPNNKQTSCVTYSADGFKDKPCDDEYYYTCSKDAGSFLICVHVTVSPTTSFHHVPGNCNLRSQKTSKTFLIINCIVLLKGYVHLLKILNTSSFRCDRLCMLSLTLKFSCHFNLIIRNIILCHFHC